MANQRLTWSKIAMAPFRLLKRIIVVPYYRFYFINTEYPFDTMLQNTKNPSNFLRLFDRWRKRKLAEFRFTLTACTILAAAVIGSFSWDGALGDGEAYWLTAAFWYYSLVLSILGILLGAQLSSAIEHLGRPSLKSEDGEDSEGNRWLFNSQTNGDSNPVKAPKSPPQRLTPRNTGDRLAEFDEVKEAKRYMPLILTPIDDARTQWTLKRKTLFIWQCPMMFMSYSAWGFMGGLTMFVCTPLIRKQYLDWNSKVNVAIVYLITLFIAGGMYAYCSFWVFKYVDLKTEAQDIYMMRRHHSGLDQNDPAGAAQPVPKAPAGDSNA